MRLLIMALLAVGLGVGACTRSDVASPAAGPAAVDARVAPTNGAPNGAVATAGTKDAPPSVPPTTATPTTATPTTATWREVIVPAGTTLPIVLETAVGSDTSRLEQPVQAHLVRGIVVNGQTVLPEGSRVTGMVTDATRSGKVKGVAHVAMRFDTVVPRGEDERYTIRAATVRRSAPATKKKDALKIGAPAAGGAIVGGILGGKKGALIGTAAGGGAGTAVVMSTRGKEIHLPKGAALTIRLAEPLTIRVRH